MDQVVLSKYVGTGVVVSIPKEKWDAITPDDLENARPPSGNATSPYIADQRDAELVDLPSVGKQVQ
jgi:kynurenine formamidase